MDRGDLLGVLGLDDHEGPLLEPGPVVAVGDEVFRVGEDMSFAGQNCPQRGGDPLAMRPCLVDHRAHFAKRRFRPRDGTERPGEKKVAMSGRLAGALAITVCALIAFVPGALRLPHLGYPAIQARPAGACALNVVSVSPAACDALASRRQNRSARDGASRAQRIHLRRSHRRENVRLSRRPFGGADQSARLDRPAARGILALFRHPVVHHGRLAGLRNLS